MFTPVDGHIVSRGAVSNQDTTPQACEQSCRSNSSCKSYQLDTNPGRQLCWIQLSESPFVASNRYFDSNIIEYIKNTSCYNSELLDFPAQLIDKLLSG